MADASVSCGVSDGVATLTIERERARNTLDLATIEALRFGLEGSIADDTVRVVVLTGAGTRAFCAGADLSLIKAWTALSEKGSSPFVELIGALMRSPKPVVALVNGAVLGGGVGLLLACDLALAAEDAWVSTPEVHVGMFPFMVFPLLEAQVGRRQAMEMALTGCRIPAIEARAMGLFSRVASRESLHEELRLFLDELRKSGPTAISLGKEAIRTVLDPTLFDNMAKMSTFFGRCLASPEFAEGSMAFLQKREPSWRRPPGGGRAS